MTGPQLPTPEQIAQRAYELYLERGREDGHEVEDWIAAEKELTELAEARLAEPKALAAGSGA